MFSFLGPDIQKMNMQLKQPGVKVPSLPLVGCVTKDKLLNLSVSFSKKMDFLRIRTSSLCCWGDLMR